MRLHVDRMRYSEIYYKLFNYNNCMCEWMIMGISYNKLWKLLIDKKMSVAELRQKADIAPNTMTRMRKEKEVTMQVLCRICAVLDADFGDIVEFVPEELTIKN